MNGLKIYAKRLGKLNPSKINGQPSRRLQKGKQNLILPLEDSTNKIRFEETGVDHSLYVFLCSVL